MKSEKQKMLAGEAYLPGDPELKADAQRAREWMAPVRLDQLAALAPNSRCTSAATASYSLRLVTTCMLGP